jgi:hypothetical protein
VSKPANGDFRFTLNAGGLNDRFGGMMKFS